MWERDARKLRNERDVKLLRASNARMRAAITNAIEAIERGSTSAPVLEVLKAAITR
jgi:hypothetical protein